MSDFEVERKLIASNLSLNEKFSKSSREWMQLSAELKQSYLYDWLGIPIIQIPQDIYALQEIIFKVKPDLIIETGIARGGSLQLSASLLALLDVADFLGSSSQKNTLPKRKVVGIDIEIRSHTHYSIENSFLNPWISMIECDSTNAILIPKLQEITKKYKKVLVILDSNHTKAHVAKELALYSKFVTSESYLIVFDTVINFLDIQLPDRIWGPGNGPLDAVEEFLLENPIFEIDYSLYSKLGISCAPNGFLKKKCI
jgi:cephalosporin hydroxylase